MIEEYIQDLSRLPSFHPLLYVTQVQMDQGPAFVPTGNIRVLYLVGICQFWV